MKPLLFFMVLLGLAQQSLAQKVHFCDTSNKWKVFIWDGGSDRPCCFEYYSYNGDTTIGGVHYFLLDGAPVREDSITGKVYAYYTTAEYLLYDFKLNIGDTIHTRLAKHYVSSMDSVQINGVTHKIWNLTGFWLDSASSLLGGLNNYTVVEGVGCLAQPFFPDIPFTFELASMVVCFKNNGSAPVLSRPLSTNFDNTTSCNKTFGVGVHDLLAASKAVSILPNPVVGNATIVLPYLFTSVRLQIRNISGEVIGTQTLRNVAEMEIGNEIQLAGIYFFDVLDLLSGARFTGKFVKE